MTDKTIKMYKIVNHVKMYYYLLRYPKILTLLGVIRGVDFINCFVLYAYLFHLRPKFYTTISLSNVGLKAWIALHRVQTVFEIDPRWRPAKKILWHETIFLNFSMSGRVSQQVFLFCFVFQQVSFETPGGNLTSQKSHPLIRLFFPPPMSQSHVYVCDNG